MKGVEEALIIAVSVFVLLLFVLVGLAMMAGEEPDRPDMPASTTNKTTCSTDDDCKMSSDGARCVVINSVKGTQRFCGCYSQTDCSGYAVGACDARNKCV